MKKASMQDIADKVGVSRCAVSLVLSGKAKDKRISEALSNRIFQVAKELNYTPNELARGLRTGSTKTLGVIVADISNEFFGELVYHIQQQAYASGYSTIVTNSNEDPAEMLNGIQLLVNRQIDGIIMVPTNNSQNIAQEIVSMNLPFVQVDRFIPGIDASYVILDNFKGSYELTERLFALGRRRIAMIKHKTSALKIARFLQDHPEVKWVHYPDLETDECHALQQKYLPEGSCGVMAFALRGDRDFQNHFMDALKLVTIETHVADCYTCLLHPASHTHRQLSDQQLREAGVDPDMIRLSIGLEDPEDIINDIQYAIQQAHTL